MVIRRQRLTRFFFLLTFYCVSAALGYYFVDQAYSGKRGVEARNELNHKVLTLRGELDALEGEHKEWTQRLSLLQPDKIDRDLLEERARMSLGYVHPNDVVIMLNQP